MTRTKVLRTTPPDVIAIERGEKTFLAWHRETSDPYGGGGEWWSRLKFKNRVGEWGRGVFGCCYDC